LRFVRITRKFPEKPGPLESVLACELESQIGTRVGKKEKTNSQSQTIPRTMSQRGVKLGARLNRFKEPLFYYGQLERYCPLNPTLTFASHV